MLGLSSLYVKLIGGLVVALIVLGLVAERGRWMHRAHNAEAQVSADCKAARASASNPRMDCSQTDEQIQYLGETITALSNALKQQNSAVQALGDQTKRQQADATQASKIAQERAQGAEATATRLATSSRSGGAPAASCEPSTAAKAAWQ
jgi:hypothetical protein